MSTNLNPPATCPNCAQPLPAAAPAGLCPACLLAQGLDTDPGGGKPGRFQPLPVEEIARLFPQLEILRLLGAGGMGAVYKARQPALDRLVALKVLPPQGATSGTGVDSTERFNREARALARLSHPNIVAVHEFGFARAGDLQSPPTASPANATDGDCKSPARTQLETPNSKPETPAPLFPFFIMEFVDGANLRQLGRTARLSPREALQIIPQICDALQYAHDEGVVHRDIKPENVLVDRRGRVKIADFGLAKIFGPDGDALRLTAEGEVMGTPHYMAPEQVERPLAVDHRADIYSLGVVFYELLTGDLPLGKFAPPSRKVSVDVRLDDVVLRALENDPARRYQRASEVKSQVETITTQPAPPSSSRREEASTPAAPPPPANIIIVACLLLYHGAEALWRALNVANPEAVSFNVGLLALPVGIGLLRLRPIARVAALLLLVGVSCIHLYVIGLLWFAPEVLKTGATLNGIPFDMGAALPLTALLLLGQVAIAGWAGWTLTRPAVRTLFSEKAVTRPWLEWAVLAGTLALTALAPRWHAADAVIRAGSWILFAAVVGFGIWRWRSQARRISRREETPIPPASSRPSRSILRLAWTLLLLGTAMVLLHLAPRLLGRTPQAMEAQLTPTGLAIVGWLGLGMLSFGVLWLMKQSVGATGFPRTLAAMSLGLLATAFSISTVQGNSWVYGQHSRFMEWHLAWMNALGVLAGWWALAAMRGQAMGVGWRVLATVGALAAVVMPMMAAFRVGAGQLIRRFPALWEWVHWRDGTGYLLTMLGLAVAAVAWLGHRAWSWSRGKRELPGQRLGLALACLAGSWVVSQHQSRVQNYASASSHVAELPPGTVRLFQAHTSIGGSQSVSFSGRVAGLQPGWRLNAGWVALDGSGAGAAQAGRMATNHFHYMFAFPTAFALHRPQPVPHPQPWLIPSRVWDLAPGKREPVITVTNSVGQTLACFVELLPDTTLTPLGNSAVAVQRGVTRQANGHPVPGSAGVSLTVAPRHVTTVGVFLRERDKLVPLPELSAALAAPAGERVSRELHWEAMATDNGATNVTPQVRVSMGVAGGLPRRATVVLPEALAGYRLSPAGFSQEALLAAGELREWVLFECAPVARGVSSGRKEIVARLVTHPLAADWRPDLIQPHFRRGTNWAQLTQSNPSRQNQFAKAIPANIPGPRAPRGQITLLRWLDVSVHGNDELIAQGSAAVSGREMVLGRLRWPNGRTVESESVVRVHNTSFPINSVVGIHYAFPTNFPLALKEQAAAQLQSACNTNQPLTLLAGQWRPVFSITNVAGESVTGEMTFNPGAPSPKVGQVELEFPTDDPMQARASGAQVSLALRSEVPLGYQLLATAESPGSIRASATVYRTYRAGKVFERVIWSLNRTQSPEIMANVGAQVRAFVTRDSLLLKLGERKEVFRFTNDRGETFAGALELIAAP